jgi:predicted metal-dependent hydrolase
VGFVHCKLSYICLTRFWNAGTSSNLLGNSTILLSRKVFNSGVIGNSKRLIKSLYESWLSDNAKLILKDKVERCSQKTGLNVERVNIKNLRKRWGSLTKDKKTINLNVNLLKAHDDVIDYIILHELCHVKINDHSHHYWDLVRKYMPSYQEKIDWLNANTTSILG